MGVNPEEARFRGHAVKVECGAPAPFLISFPSQPWGEWFYLTVGSPHNLLSCYRPNAMGLTSDSPKSPKLRAVIIFLVYLLLRWERD